MLLLLLYILSKKYRFDYFKLNLKKMFMKAQRIPHSFKKTIICIMIIHSQVMKSVRTHHGNRFPES